jgi:hypothetical protein
MRWAAATAAVLVLAVAATTGDAAQRQRRGVGSTGCGSQAIAGFPHAFSKPDNLVVGPLAFVNGLGAADNSVENVEYIGGFKAPAVMRPGHTATVSIAPASRSVARLTYGSVTGKRAHTIHFTSCPRRRAMSHVDGRPATFWSGFFVVPDAPACIGVNISVDGRRPHRRVIPVARPSCP